MAIFCGAILLIIDWWHEVKRERAANLANPKQTDMFDE